VSVSLLVGLFEMLFQTIFMKQYRIVKCYHGKNKFYIGVDSTQNSQMVAILDFLYKLYLCDS